MPAYYGACFISKVNLTGSKRDNKYSKEFTAFKCTTESP